jgi:hypothetical protein
VPSHVTAGQHPVGLLMLHVVPPSHVSQSVVLPQLSETEPHSLGGQDAGAQHAFTWHVVWLG